MVHFGGCEREREKETSTVGLLSSFAYRSNMLDGEAVRSLAMCLKKMPKLEHLNISDNPLEDSGIKYETSHISETN